MGVWDENLGPFLLPVVVLLSSLFAPDGPKLQVTTVPSSWARLGSGAQLQCRFTVGSPVVLRSLRVQWYLGEQKMAWYDQGRSRVQPGASLPSEKELQSGDASLSLATVTPWDKGMYKCVVWHREHQHQGETTLHLLVGPRVSIPRQPAVANAKTSLLCHMAGFFPVDVDLAWLRDGQVLEGSTRSNSQKNLDGIFSLTLTYTFTPVISDIGSVFSCRVRHAALGQSLKEDVRLDIVAAPKISIPRQPVTADVETSLLCHVAGFFPSDVDVAWLRDGQVLKGSTRSSPQRNLDGTFSLTLTYTFTPARGDAGRVFSCCVHHAALEQSLQEDVSLVILVHTTEVDEISTLIGPILGILVVMVAAVATILSRCTNRSKGWAVPYSFSEVQVPEQCLLGQEVILHCSMEGTFPEDVAVTWERICSEDRTVPESAGDQESPEHQQLLPALPPGWRVTMQRAGTCLTSSLTFTPTVQDDGVRVRCCFLHETKCIREERVSPEIQVWARPQVSEIQVLPEWDPRDKVPFAVQLHNFYPREVPPIQWGWDGAGSWREDPAQIDKNADGTFTATSVWRVPSRSLTRPELRVQVCVQHGPGEPPSERELSLRATGLLRPPEVSEISQPKSMATGKGVTLSCRIAGHFPGELSVTWLRRRKGEATAVILRDSAECRVEPGTAVLARDGKSFQQETRLTHWTSRDQGAEYICRVGHLTLETHIERNSGCHPPPPDLGEVFRPQAPVSGEPMTLKGLLSQFYPKQLAMTWLQKRERRKEPRPLESSPPPQHRTHTPSRVPDRKSYSVDSELSLPTVGTEDGVTDYQCHVEHEALKKPKSSRKLRLKANQSPPEHQTSEDGGGS